MKEAWQEKDLGDFSEVLETLFKNRPSLLLTGVKSQRILRVARESAKYSLGLSRKQDPNSFSVRCRKEPILKDSDQSSQPDVGQEQERLVTRRGDKLPHKVLPWLC